MAIRNDVTVDFEKSPRITTIATPSTTITVQDLHDTLAGIEDSIEGAQYPNLVLSEGKGTLGGGRFTGILSTLQDVQVAFAPRTTKLETGTVTTPDTGGQTLIDSTALFVTNLVGRGDMVRNNGDGASYATVLAVESETELSTLPLAGGIDNQYDFGDGYTVFDFDECSITDGDLVAIDDGGSPLVPYLNTFGTNVTVELSTSPALIETSSSLPLVNTALPDIYFTMGSAGLSITAERSHDGATSWSPAGGSITEVANGAYSFDATAADMNAISIAFRFSAAGVADAFASFRTRAS